MRPAFFHKSILAPSGWQELSQGQWIADQVDERLAAWWPRIFGYHMVKVGSLSRELDTSRCTIRNQVSIASEPGAQLLADIAKLPFQEASVDACLMAMNLNFHHNPHQLLREVNRITVAGGHLVLVGLNPFSPLGLASLNPQLQHRYPWNGRFFSQGRVMDWLSVLGYKVIGEQKLVYSSLLMAPERTRWLQLLSERYMPGVGSVYILLAKKMVKPLTPIKAKWQIKSKLVTSPAPSMRETAGH